MLRRIDLAILPFALALPLAAACSGTADGGAGDPPSVPDPDEYGSGARIQALIGPATWVDDTNADSTNCPSPLERNVDVTGVAVVAIDHFDETGGGQLGNIYVEDTAKDPSPYSGVTVFAPSFSPPDLRLQVGDAADLHGVLSEFLGPTSGPFGGCRTLPEVGGTMVFRFDSGHVAPRTIPLTDLKTYPTSRQWLGMLVRVEGVKLAKAGLNSSGRYTAEIDVGGGIAQTDVPKLSNELFDLENEGPTLAAGTTFTAVTGVVTYFYGFKIAPRSAADFEP